MAVDPFASASSFDADPFADDSLETADATEAAFVKMDDLEGRLLWVLPLEKGSGISRNDGKPYHYVVCTVMVLDGDPTDLMPSFPHRLDEFRITGSNVVPGLAAKIGQNSLVLGRLVHGKKTPGKNPPWLLNPPTDADRAVKAEAAKALRAAR